jgi:hypothetical protein
MQVPLTLTENNVRKMVRGYPIQLSKAQLNGSDHYLKVHPLTHKKISLAKVKGKGVRLHLTQQEVADSGEGFRDIWNKIKQGASWLKSNVIDTPLYQSAVRPILRQGVDTVASAVESRFPVAKPLIEASVNKLSDVTGAFGLETPKVKATKRIPKKAAKGIPKKAAPGGSFLLG